MKGHCDCNAYLPFRKHISFLQCYPLLPIFLCTVSVCVPAYTKSFLKRVYCSSHGVLLFTGGWQIEQ